ncbi:aromatic ring-hydroxylating dioxygenase subunit alpha [Novosphingobium pentaromativorans]|uniref:Vanillate monooxygenase n=1 Tax=Novosphingobium pentaromativorans US6-1 TaxID=1088721 RepID=G6EH05_9SPHN|nr:aromatic ring-hydroxylating dioxygenase subunit alpha [Novosphingobium pentaromativorans]AIT82008.1 Rieske (2Fe-2S) protein [Novosphingobium pentaromativorans US6-1]EHJ59294.1 vanillate monooxygenase [Novosphingobium pentaromativorans US6-1]
MSTWLTNQWYVAAWDAEVDSAPLSRTICGVPVMLYRKLDRSVVAMRDACPHRLLPLSMGIREGDSIRCKYHGLKLGPDGVAEEMPLKSEAVNKRVCAETFAVAEKHRFIWIWVGEKDKADPALIPDLWPCSTKGWVFDGGYYPIKCDYRLMIDNLMDLTHETYVHSSSIGQEEILEAPLECRVEDERVFLSRWMPGIDAPPFWRNALKKPGPVDRWQICQFLLPSAVMIDVGVAPVDAGATLEDHDQGVRGMVVDFMTPETETSHHYFWGMARNFDIDDTGFTARFKAQQGGVFAEDREILEAQQAAILANPGKKLAAYRIDEGGVRARQIITRKMRAAEEVDG